MGLAHCVHSAPAGGSSLNKMSMAGAFRFIYLFVLAQVSVCASDLFWIMCAVIFAICLFMWVLFSEPASVCSETSSSLSALGSFSGWNRVSGIDVTG